jgi:hypothetical protein
LTTSNPLFVWDSLQQWNQDRKTASSHHVIQPFLRVPHHKCLPKASPVAAFFDLSVSKGICNVFFTVDVCFTHVYSQLRSLSELNQNKLV